MRACCCLIVLATVALLAACDSANPVAPSGTVLLISASPDQIGLTGSAQIRVVARRGNGTPVSAGTVIRFSTNLGDIEPAVETDAAGEARALLRGTGTRGTAKVTATSGSAEAVTVDVKIGFVAASISLQTTPTSVPETGGTVDLLAIVRNEQGQGLALAEVNFRSDVGALASGGALLVTDPRGEARDMLEVTAGDLDAIAGDTFRVLAEVGGSGGALITANAMVAVLRLPSANFNVGINNLTVVFTDTSTGRPTSWRWDFGDGNNSTRQSPIHTYSGAGTFTVTLEVSNNLGSDVFSRFVAVTGQ